MFVPDDMGNIGFPGWQLQNNSANIRRMKKRLIELQTKEATPSSETTFTSGKIVDNSEADRIQLFFGQIPDEATRTKLKNHGWHWSHRNSAWQRKRTPQALQNAYQIVGGELKC